jgi:hypothetical protein
VRRRSAREEDDAVTLVRVYCGLASADLAERQPSPGDWLTLAIVDDAGRLLDICDVSDDAAGYAELGSLLAERSNGPASVAVAADSEEHVVSQLLTAAGRNLAYTDDDTAEDYAERFGDDDSIDEIESNPAERRAIGLARALQAGVLSAVPQPTPRDLLGLKPVLAAHAAVTSGRQGAAATLREVLRELYPAALRAYPDPAEALPLAVLEALPESGLLGSGTNGRNRDGQIVADLTAAGAGDSATVTEAVTALRVAVAETPRRTGMSRTVTAAVATTIRQAVAAVRACDAAASALIGVLADKMLTVGGAGSPPARTVSRARASAAPAAAAPPPPAPPLRAVRETAPEPARPATTRRGRTQQPAAPAARAEKAQSKRGDAASAVPPLMSTLTPPPPPPGITPILPTREPGRNLPPASPLAPASGPPAHAAPAAHAAPPPAVHFGQPPAAHLGSPPGPAGPRPPIVAQPVSPASPPPLDLPVTSAPPAYAPLPALPPMPVVPAPLTPPTFPGFEDSGELRRYSPDFINTPAPRPSPDVSPPGSRRNWPLVGDPLRDEYPAAPRSPAHQAPPPPEAPLPQRSPTFPPSGDAFDSPSGELPRQRVTPPWQADDLPAEPPALRLVDPAPLPDPALSKYQEPDTGGHYPPPDLRLVDPARRERDWRVSDRPQKDTGYSRVRIEDVPDHLDAPISPAPAGEQSDDGLLIFAATRSAWFTDHDEAGSDEMDWTSPSDLGWRAAEQAAHPVVGADTESGLPRRVPQQNLVPGSPISTPDRPLRIVRDAATIAAHTTGYFRGWRRGQEVGGYAVGGRPGRESAGGWDFSRDQSGRDNSSRDHSSRDNAGREHATRDHGSNGRDYQSHQDRDYEYRSARR